MKVKFQFEYQKHQTPETSLNIISNLYNSEKCLLRWFIFLNNLKFTEK